MDVLLNDEIEWTKLITVLSNKYHTGVIIVVISNSFSFFGGKYFIQHITISEFIYI